MTGLLCRIGLHKPVWTPVIAAPGAQWAPPIRKCRTCGRHLPQTHR